MDPHTGKIKPPISSHLCLFYKAEIDEDFDRILVELNKSEVHKLGWVSLEQLADSLLGRGDTAFKGAYEYDPGVMLHAEPNCIVKTDRLFPIKDANKYQEGLGKGHWLAIKHLLREEGFSGFDL